MDEKILGEIFSNIISEGDKKAQNEPLFDFFMERSEWFGDPREMHIMISSQFFRIISQVVKYCLNTDDWLIQTIYKDWGFIESNVTHLCERLYGPTCCADRGRFIAKSAIRWRISGELPEFKPEISENFHHPKTGTGEQWMAFVKGLGKLRYGNPEQYLKAYMALIKS